MPRGRCQRKAGVQVTWKMLRSQPGTGLEKAPSKQPQADFHLYPPSAQSSPRASGKLPQTTGFLSSLSRKNCMEPQQQGREARLDEGVLAVSVVRQRQGTRGRWQRLLQPTSEAGDVSHHSGAAISNRCDTKNFKHAAPDCLLRGTDPFSSRFSN